MGRLSPTVIARCPPAASSGQGYRDRIFLFVRATEYFPPPAPAGEKTKHIVI